MVMIVKKNDTPGVRGIFWGILLLVRCSTSCLLTRDWLLSACVSSLADFFCILSVKYQVYYMWNMLMEGKPATTKTWYIFFVCQCSIHRLVCRTSYNNHHVDWICCDKAVCRERRSRGGSRTRGPLNWNQVRTMPYACT